MSILKRLKAILAGNKDSVEPSEEAIKPDESFQEEQSVEDVSTINEEKPQKMKIEIVEEDNSETINESPEADISEKVEEAVDEESETDPVESVDDDTSHEEVESVNEAEIVSAESYEEESVEDDSEAEKELEIEKNSEDDKEESSAKLENKKAKDREDKMTLLEKDDNLITRNAIDPEFTQMFKDAGAETVEHCFQCGTCSGSCPSGRRTPYKIRQIVRKSLMGMKEAVISDPNLWMCTTCYTCQERCPRSVEIVDIIKLARNEAAKAGYMSPSHKATGLYVSKSGHGVPINAATKELRKRIGLDELPPTTHTYPEALKEVQNIIKDTGFDDLIGLNWEKMELE